jgi:FAD/FMN-containing dehydrogenase
MSTARSADLEQAERLCQLFGDFRPRISANPLFDFSTLHRSQPVFCEVSPTSAQEVSSLVQVAAREGISLRIRGKGHALNGSSLPRAAELVVQTQKLTHMTGGDDGTISVGAGAVLWNLDAELRKNGCSLPVLNAGYAGPSVGGFVAAGGFGPGSRFAGGFWNNVAEITIVNGHGVIQRIARADPLFPWLFGSMGQLGITVEARLDIRTSVSEIMIPGPSSAENTTHVEAPTSLNCESGRADRLFWFTLFVHEGQVPEARARLDALELRHSKTFSYRDRYTYFIAHRKVVAPLIWPQSTPCFAVGSWGRFNDLSASGIQRLMAFEADFMKVALRNGYKRYIQSEMACGPQLYEYCFGSEAYNKLRHLKQIQDPQHLINHGWVFVGRS